MDQGLRSRAHVRANDEARPPARRRRLACALAALALLPAIAHAKCTIQAAELPVRMVGVRPIATVGIEGQSVPLMVDSGASFSFLTAAAAAQLKLPVHAPSIAVQGLDGRVDVDMTTVKKLELLGSSIPDVGFIVGGTEPGSGSMGIMGRDILSLVDTEYDLAHGVIRFVVPSEDCSNANMAYWAGTTPVSEIELLRDHDNPTPVPAIRGLIKVNHKPVLAVFDSGSSATTITLDAAHEAGVADGDMRFMGTGYGAAGKGAKSWSAAFAKIDLGGEVIRNSRIGVSDFHIHEDMLLGIDFFLSHRIYVSRKRRLMFLTYNGGRVFTDNIVAPAEAAASGASSAGAADDAPLTADAYARRGAASASRRDYASALADLDRACALAPDSAAFLAQRGQIHLQLRQPDQAMQDFDKALQIDPRQSDALMLRASMRAQAKNADGALTDLAELDKALAPEAQMRVEMGHLYLSLHAPAQAVAQYDRWLPNHAHEFQVENVLYERCWARVQLGTELDKAMDDCDAAVHAKAKNAVFLAARGWVWLRQGKPAQARDDFDRALAIKPNAAFALYGRGLARSGLGEQSPGQADLAAARKADAEIDAKIARDGLPRAP